MKKILRDAATLAIASAALGLVSPAVSSGTLTVLPDRNATQSTNDTLSNNGAVFDQILGDNTRVLFNRRTEGQNLLLGRYNASPGVDANVRLNVLPNLSTTTELLRAPLSEFDLLVVTRAPNEPVDYSPEEVAEIVSFSQGGGDILFIAEALDNNLDFDTGLRPFDSYNAFLSALGSSIRYVGDDWVVARATDTSLAATPVSSAGDTFTVDAYNHLLGGTAVATDPDGRAFLAYEDLGNVAVIPVPASLPLLLGPGALLLGMGWRRSRS